MKKLFAIILALTMLLSLAACDSGEKPQQTTAPAETTVPAQTEQTVPETTEAPEVTQTPVSEGPDFCFTFENVVLTPGTIYDAAALPEPNSVYQVPSCAIEGTDNVYSFDALDITAFHDGTQEIIYAITLFDPNVCTDEGLYLGDDAARVIELYGENYAENGSAMVYTRANTMLTVILQNGYVVSIEFTWITD